MLQEAVPGREGNIPTHGVAWFLKRYFGFGQGFRFMLTGQLQEPPQIFLGDIFPLQFSALLRPFGTDGGKRGLFPIFDGLQNLLAGFNPCPKFGKELAALR